jgi:hypothetical protein
MAGRKKASKNKFFQLRIALKDSPLPIWRRLLVNGDITLDQLHEILQLTMGWSGYHIHHFHFGTTVYGDLIDAKNKKVKDQTVVKLVDLIDDEGEAFVYKYDLVSGWEHDIKVERIVELEGGPQLARCIMGKRACPPEDVGGTEGYRRFIEIVEDPENPAIEEQLSWVGCDFDANSFDARLVNLQLTLMEANLENAFAAMA